MVKCITPVAIVTWQICNAGVSSFFGSGHRKVIDQLVKAERQLSFGEDDLLPDALILDIAVYFAITVLVIVEVTRSPA